MCTTNILVSGISFRCSYVSWQAVAMDLGETGLGRKSPSPDKVSSAADAMLRLSSSGSGSQGAEANASDSTTAVDEVPSVSTMMPTSWPDQTSPELLRNMQRNTRKQRQFIPDFKKDDQYWMKRRKNNEAAKRSREKRRVNDAVMGERVAQLTRVNTFLRKELRAIKEHFGLPLDKPFIEPEDLSTGSQMQDYSLSASDSESSLVYPGSSGSFHHHSSPPALEPMDLPPHCIDPPLPHCSLPETSGLPPYRSAPLPPHSLPQDAQTNSRDPVTGLLPHSGPVHPQVKQSGSPPTAFAGSQLPVTETSSRSGGHSVAGGSDSNTRESSASLPIRDLLSMPPLLPLFPITQDDKFPFTPARQSTSTGSHGYLPQPASSMREDDHLAAMGDHVGDHVGGEESDSSSTDLKIALSGGESSNEGEPSQRPMNLSMVSSSHTRSEDSQHDTAPGPETFGVRSHVDRRKGVPLKLWHKISSEMQREAQAREQRQAELPVSEQSERSPSFSVSSTSNDGADAVVDGNPYPDPKYSERRMRNNLAAKKCRENRKALNNLRLAKSSILETENLRLRQELHQLTSEIGELRDLLEKKKMAEAKGEKFEPPPVETLPGGTVPMTTASEPP